jgi:hypothetical protein
MFGQFSQKNGQRQATAMFQYNDFYHSMSLRKEQGIVLLYVQSYRSALAAFPALVMQDCNLELSD